MALLTPKDIREHTFQTVRFKEGYDVDEVDDFLDQVTETVEALGKQAVASGQATQSLPPDVAKLNFKISELTAQVQSLQSENEQLKSAAPVASKDDQAAQVAAAKLTEAEESNRALSQQNEQLKDQVDRLSGQIDQLTAQAAQASGKADVAAQLAAVQNERDQYRVSARDMSGRLQEAQQQAASYQQQLNDAKKHLDALQQQAAQASDLARQLEESKQRENQLREQVAKVEPSTETGSLQKIAGAAAAASSEPERATAMLTLAMQLHDQYVDKGKAKAKEITEASQNKYNELVTKANDYSSRTRTEADEYNKQVHSDADAYSERTRSDADAYSVKTRQDADTYRENTQQQADNYEDEVRRRAGEYDSKTRSNADEYAQQVRDKLTTQSKVIEGNIQGLKQFEAEYRARLTEFLGQLSRQVSDTNNYSQIGKQAE
ncbi:MAG: DivIVA domain-containing protein [Bifidobacterium bifidum]